MVEAVFNGKFTPCVASYDAFLDMEEVDQSGFVDLRQAFLTGMVDGMSNPAEESFSGVDEPDGILPVPKDRFDAIRQAQYVASSARSSRSSKSVEPAAAAASPTEGGDASSAAGE